MMKLTKKESLHNLKIIITKGGSDDEFLKIYQYLKYEIDYMFNLIDEHFDNPPLKFEELKEGMWVWDIEWCQFRKLIDAQDFEENRFYRKQVEE